MNTLEALFISAAGALPVYVYQRYRWRKYQQTLQWFYTKQVYRSSAQAEIVREQLLQKAFALRRALELSALTATSEASEQLNHCLELAEALNHSLEKVSNELLEPFVEDSLPLALQHFLKGWRETWDEVDLTLNLPSEWPWQQTVKYSLLLWCLYECLHLCQARTKAASPKALHLTLVHENNIAKLQLTFRGQSLQEAGISSGIDELAYVRQVFQILMPGRCKLECSSSQLTGEFSWSVTSQNNELSF